jgi:formylmethanofuran dehydrogenase subunit C
MVGVLVSGNDKVQEAGNMTIGIVEMDGDMNTTIGGNQYTTITGETHTRNEGVLYTYIGDDTHTTKASDKTDYTTLSIRESGTPATEPTSS